jgi:thiamine biosynthesis lipoprotein
MPGSAVGVVGQVADHADPAVYKHVEHCMGTVFSFHVAGAYRPADAVADAVAWLHWVDETFSTYQHDSAISRLGRGEITLADCPAQVAEVLDRCADVQAETDGFFCAYAGGQLDPSGWVKGWAIQRASDILLAAGAANHMLNGGGDVQCRGARPDGGPWRIGITDPRNSGLLLGIVEGNQIAVATSGTAERGAHILDPHTGTAPAGLLSVTVIGQRLALIDAYATAAFAMGSRAAQWLDSRGLQHVLVPG